MLVDSRSYFGASPAYELRKQSTHVVSMSHVLMARRYQPNAVATRSRSSWASRSLAFDTNESSALLVTPELIRYWPQSHHTHKSSSTPPNGYIRRLLHQIGRAELLPANLVPLPPLKSHLKQTESHGITTQGRREHARVIYYAFPRARNKRARVV